MTSPKAIIASSHIPADGSEDESITRLSAQNTLEPGQYWRLVKPTTVKNPHSSRYADVALNEGDLHLIVKLFDFEGVLHSVTFLEHPRDAHKDRFSSHTLLTADFLSVFEHVPLDVAKAERAREQADVMAGIAVVQEEMQKAQLNPLALPDVQRAAKKAVEEFEAAETNRVQAVVQDVERRAADLRRIHRRAAKRSEAKGNPLALRTATISDRLDVMISEGVTSDGVRELQLEAGRRMAIAEATSKWLTERSKKMAVILERVTPYLAEQGQLAMAGASSAIERVSEIERGITSLKLYTGDGVDVIPVREGVSSATDVPLTLCQQKLAMDEELAVFADVEDNFDYTSQEVFFKRLAEDDRLRDQIFPTQRCVVSMLATRRHIDYGRDTPFYEAMLRNIANKRVFLLVRNGANIYAVYSGEPSHEAACRLFPTEAEIHKPFRGIDGSTIGLQDVAFGKATKNFDDQALHYRRFLILLCGLDHRLNLFGEFFPPEDRMSFMALSFQERYFRFLENDDPARLLGGKTESVGDWMRRHNAGARSGSRIVAQTGYTLAQAASGVRRSHTVRVNADAIRYGGLVACEKHGNLYLSVPTVNDHGQTGFATAWITGPEVFKSESYSAWFLCIDRLTLAEVRSYVYDRQQRIGSISWLRTLRRVEQTLVADDLAQSALKAYLRVSALAAAVHTTATVDDAIDGAIATWRADHRGAPAPAMDEQIGVQQLLSLVYPKDHLETSMRPLIDGLCAREALSPLQLTRTGKNQFALYSVASDTDRAEFSHGVEWGWVRRHLIKVGRTKASLGSASLVWLQLKTLDLNEESVIRWPELQDWIHEEPEPIRLLALAKAKTAMEFGQSVVDAIHHCRLNSTSLDESLVGEWITTLKKKAEGLRYNQTPWITLVLGIYQESKNAAPVYLCARANFLHFLSVHGSGEQQRTLTNASGFRSAHIREKLSSAESVNWRAIVCDEFPAQSVELEAQATPGKTAYWASFETHKRGGIRRKSRSHWTFGLNAKCTRASRREKGGDAQHESHTVRLSWNRAIDSLMGIQPLQQKAFYAGRKERVSRVWSGISDDPVPLATRRKQEANRAFIPKLPVAVHLAPCLWDADKGRSMANSFLGPKFNTRPDCGHPLP